MAMAFLDLQDFILRAQVLKFYRQALRTARRAPTDSRDITMSEIVTGELTQMIRQEMVSNRNCSDKQRIRYLMSEGQAKLKNLSEMLDMQGYG